MQIAHLSDAKIANWDPSLLSSMALAVALAFAHAYRSVSKEELNATSSEGNPCVVADQYSITPAQHGSLIMHSYRLYGSAV